MRSWGWVAGGLAGWAFAAVTALSLATPAAAAPPPYPAAEGRCVDQAGVLGRALCAKVTAVLLRDEKVTSDEIAVAVVPTTGGASIEKFSTGLFNTWGVGKKAKNNGVLLVVAVDDHALRLETGRGMATRLDDDAAGKIVNTVITPHFADGEYALGILTGLDEVRRKIGHRVPAAARLENLAGQAPNPADRDSTGAQDDTSISDPDGAGWTSDRTNVLDSDGGLSGEDFPGDGDDSGSPLGLFAFAGVAMIAVLVFGLATSRSSGTGSGRRWTSSSRPMSTRHSSWTTTTMTDSSSSSISDSGSGSSSFGGGSSDGGGASGSW